MPTVKEVRQALADAVNTVEGLRGIAGVPTAVNPPQANVYRTRTVYDEVMHSPDGVGAATYTFNVRVILSRGSERSSEDLMDEYAEPGGVKSIVTAIYTDATLMDLVDTVRATEEGFGPLLDVTVGDVVYIGADLEVVVGVS